jgi:hypothetical protein
MHKLKKLKNYFCDFLYTFMCEARHPADPGDTIPVVLFSVFYPGQIRKNNYKPNPATQGGF